MLALCVALLLTQTESPVPDAVVAPETAKPAPHLPPSVATRSLLAAGGGVLAGGAALGITMLLVGQNPRFDPTFATAGLAALMITGVAFSIHQALGGHGEITVAFLFTALVMAGAALASTAIESAPLLTPLWVAAIGSVPASAAAVLGLELTTPKARAPLRASLTPTGLFVSF